jgi:hypothetical protein
MRDESCSTPATAAPVCAVASAADERLRHLFRAFLKQGRIHPLYLPLLQYRATENH